MSKTLGAARRILRAFLGAEPGAHERGQVLALFVLASVSLIGSAAIAADVSFLFVSQQRMQRAADAAALAGAVFLPGDEDRAFETALAEAARNGYAHETDGIDVQPSRDPGNPRRLVVDIDQPVGTYFARVFCWDGGPCLESVDVGVQGRAEYVMPVPMGSPENYYGVGFYQGKVPGGSSYPQGQTEAAILAPPDLPPGRATSNIGGSWTYEDRAYLNDNRYATASADGHASTWLNFDLLGGTSPVPEDASLAIRGIEVYLTDVYLTGTGTATSCRVDVELSWGGGASNTWSTIRPTSAIGTGTNDDRTVGTPDDIGAWGSHTWTRGELDDANFRVRLTWREGQSGCPTTRAVRLDQLQVVVHYQTTVTTPTTYPVLSVPDPGSTTGGTLDSQGFWGAIFTSGGVRENGDRYAPLYIGGNSPPDGTNGGPNPNYDAGGYDYTVEVGANGQVRLFDPVFCATGPNLTGGWLGAGDHWTTDGTGGNTTIGPVAVRFTLFDTKETPYTTLDDDPVGSPWTHDPGSLNLGDFSGSFGTPQNNTATNRQDCSAHAAHNQWVLPTGWSGLSAGTYRVNVNTNLGQNANLGAENLFSIWVKSDGRARVYGGGRMAAYTNLDDSGGGRQKFFLSQIEQTHAGKTMVITLFDPGEASSPSYLRFLSPSGGSYHYTSFDWYSNDGRSGTNVTEVQTSTGSALFNNRVLTIEIALPATYGEGGLDPDGLGEDGWWKVEYDVRAGNDTTTWEVEIRGNPVHLVIP